jgi:hypothetical protein
MSPNPDEKLSIRRHSTPPDEAAWSALSKQPHPCDASKTLDAKLQTIIERFDLSFGSQSKEPEHGGVERATALVAFVRGISSSLLREAHATREQDPLAQALFERCDAELRHAIPLLSAQEKISLLRSGYPVGSGSNSLSEVCATSERAINGTRGVMTLFSQCRSKNDPHFPWSADLLRVAHVMLKNAPSDVIASYMKGLRLMFQPSSAWASQAHEVFNEREVKLPLSVLTDIYSRIRESDAFAIELKFAVLSTIIDSIERSTEGFFRADLVALKNGKGLPLITQKDIEPVRTISRQRAKASEITRKDVERLAATIKRWIAEATSLDRTVEGKHPGSNTMINNEGEDPTLAPSAQLQLESATPNVSQELAGAFANLDIESLRAYLANTLNNGLQEPSSELSMAFTRALENVRLEKLLVIRSVLESSNDIPAIHTQALDGRIQNELLSTLPTLDAVGLADIYQICVRRAARQDEVSEVLKALRARLNLPSSDEGVTTKELSAAALLVWRWMFSDLPPDSALLADVTRAHFNKIMRHIARSVSAHTPRGSALDATLRYGKELGILESYKPAKSLLELPLAKLITFTTLLRQQIGDRHGIVETLLQAVCSRLMTEDLKTRDAFPQQWRASLNEKAIEDLCADIARRLAKSSATASFEEITFLVTNMRFLERRGPSHFIRLYEYLRPLFIRHISGVSPSQLQEQEPQELRRSVKALAATRYRSIELLDALSTGCVTHADSFSPDELGEIGFHLATLQGGTPIFWSTLASRLEKDWHAFSDDKRMFAIVSLVLNAPEKVPQSFDSYAMITSSGDRSYEKVVQALIALGRYIPRANDSAYRRLTTMQTPHELYQHEIDFMRDLPAHIGVPAKSIFSQVIVGGFETDFVVDFGHRRLIIELDGAAHFLTGPDGGILQGRDAFQDIVFRRLGYEVVHVPLHSREKWHKKGGLDYPMLQSLVAILKREALDPKTVPLVYLEPLQPNSGRSPSEPPSDNTEPL